MAESLSLESGIWESVSHLYCKGDWSIPEVPLLSVTLCTGWIDKVKSSPREMEFWWSGRDLK
jgi:hypothetical protein